MFSNEEEEDGPDEITPALETTHEWHERMNTIEYNDNYNYNQTITNSR